MTENYRMSPSGRVKAAGLSYAMFTDPAQQFIDQPSISSAALMIAAYAALRKSPPDHVRDRFFPRNPETSGMLKNGAALPRTSITTHQGVGQFLVHTLESKQVLDRQFTYKVDKQTGFCILEVHLEKQLNSHHYPSELMTVIEEVKTRFGENDLREAQLAYERLIIAVEQYGVKVSRDAQVGREGLFFIHPSVPTRPITVDKNLHQAIAQTGNSFAETLSQRASAERTKLAKKLGITSSPKKRDFAPLYFQIDFLLTADGKVQISDVNIPDVGFFLTTINHAGNEVVLQAKDTVAPLLENVVISIINAVRLHRSKTINIVTRRSVIENDEDTLEIREIQALTRALKKLGVGAKVISLDETSNLTNKDLAILMNVDTRSQTFNQLIVKRISDESIPMYPDPFLLLAKDELTDHRQIILEKKQLTSLREIFVALERTSTTAKAYVLISSINQMFHDMGLPDEDVVFHMYIDTKPTPVPFFRYDARGLQIALNYAKDCDRVIIRVVPIKKNNSVLYDENNNPIYSVFRYMFYQ